MIFQCNIFIKLFHVSSVSLCMALQISISSVSWFLVKQEAQCSCLLVKVSMLVVGRGRAQLLSLTGFTFSLRLKTSDQLWCIWFRNVASQLLVLVGFFNVWSQCWGLVLLQWFIICFVIAWGALIEGCYSPAAVQTYAKKDASFSICSSIISSFWVNTADSPAVSRLMWFFYIIHHPGNDTLQGPKTFCHFNAVKLTLSLRSLWFLWEPFVMKFCLIKGATF